MPAKRGLTPSVHRWELGVKSPNNLFLSVTLEISQRRPESRLEPHHVRGTWEGCIC